MARITFMGTAFDIRTLSSAGVARQITVAMPPASIAWAFPAPLPRKDALLLSSCTNNCANMRLFALDLKTKEQHDLVPGAARGWYVESGHLIYIQQDGSVFAQKFDPRASR